MVRGLQGRGAAKRFRRFTPTTNEDPPNRQTDGNLSKSADFDDRCRDEIYVPAGEVQLGSFAQAERSAKEVERRAKWAREADWRAS